MAQYLPYFFAICAAMLGAFVGISRCIREYYHGKSKLVRAQRGDPEAPLIIRLPAPKRSA